MKDNWHKIWFKSLEKSGTVCAVISQLSKGQIIVVRDWCNFVLKENKL